MKNFSEWSQSTDPDFSSRKCIAFDLDDTLTEHGRLSSEIIDSLESAAKKGWKLFLVTGRPAGWADAIIKLLPFDGVVAENGGLVYYWSGGQSARKIGVEPERRFWTHSGYMFHSPKSLDEKRNALAEKILKAHPKARIASDQPFRIYDLAIDFAEEVVPPLGLDEANQIAALFESEGAVAKVSSIHVNGWWGDFNKASCLKMLLGFFGLSLSECIYVGDSPNDGPLFEVAGLSIGVANIEEFVGKVKFCHPKWKTSAPSQKGSIEILYKLRQI